MHGLARLQLIGPLVLFCAVGMAEAAAYALADTPSSALLWYLNLEVFGIFRRSRAFLADYVSLPFAQLMLVAPLAILAMAGLARRRRLLAAISSNLSFVYAIFVLFCWHYWNSIGQVRAASLAMVQVPTGSALYLLATLLAASFLSFAASHYIYIRLLRSRPC